jgi:hypothetical protein
MNNIEESILNTYGSEILIRTGHAIFIKWSYTKFGPYNSAVSETAVDYRRCIRIILVV